MHVCVTIANDKHKYIFQKYTIQTSLSILLSSTHIKYYSFDICQDPFSSLDLQVLKTMLDCLAVFVCFFKFLFSEGNFKMRTDLSCILVQHKYTLHKSNRVAAQQCAMVAIATICVLRVMCQGKHRDCGEQSQLFLRSPDYKWDIYTTNSSTPSNCKHVSPPAASLHDSLYLGLNQNDHITVIIYL